jgi:hypothetical protein
MADEWADGEWLEPVNEPQPDEEWIEEPNPHWLKQCWEASKRARLEGRDESSQPPMGWASPSDEQIEAFCDGLLNCRASGDIKMTPMIEPLRNIRSADPVQNYVDGILWARERFAEGERGQPPMVQRLRFVLRLVRALEARGIPFGVSPNSRMNKLVRKVQIPEQAARDSGMMSPTHSEIIPPAVPR